ncbi:MAG: hypothetical protein PHE06_00645 [Lachnospiraceae bacterium]|nr:hypothetical protein [Lachnospiraceae bacterium]MDD3794474.1 hypothetical protein [Lachnospiraceae bacterium]
MSNKIRATFIEGDGVFRMVPAFVPVKFGAPGRRLKIHPDDYFAYGADAGTVMERWFCSVSGCRTKNEKRPDQGLSYVLAADGTQFLLKDAVAELKEDLIGKELQEKYGTFPVFAKFFDYETPLYFHFHPRKEIAEKVGCEAKPECYYFPPQLNNYSGRRSSTFFGFNKGVTREDVRECIEHFSDYDTHITDMSRAYNIQPGQGWYVPAGVIHAPGSLLTYEPQWGTDLNCVLENVVCGEVFDEHFMTDIVPDNVENRIDYIMDAIDWDANYEADFKEKYNLKALVLPETQKGLLERYVCYNNEFVTSKEVTIEPGCKVILKDKAAYGCVIVQGFGKFGKFEAEAVNLMRVGDQTADEYFVSKARATEGVLIENHSQVEPMVILQHFGPDNAVYRD